MYMTGKGGTNDAEVNKERERTLQNNEKGVLTPPPIINYPMDINLITNQMYRKLNENQSQLIRYLTYYLIRMKLTLWIMLVAMLPLSAKLKAQKVTLEKNTKTLNDAFRAIKDQTGYHFLWEARQVDGNSPVRIAVLDQPVEQAVQMLLQGLPLSYKLEKKTFLIREKKKPTIPSSSAHRSVSQFSDREASVSQQQQITHIVLDTLGKPLANVTVRVKGKDILTTSSSSGFYTLPNLSADDIVIFQLLGYQTREIPFARITPIITLKLSVSTLDEVQVMAYGTTSRRTSTGNITKVSGATINNTPTTNPMLALEGRVPGLIVTQSSGVAGSKVDLQIRGRTRIDGLYGAKETPLIILDGVPMASEGGALSFGVGTGTGTSGAINGGLSPFSMLSPGDIESIEVLKDADATSIYGSRAASGVILITTKKAQYGLTSVDLRVRSGFSKAPTPDLLTTKDYLDMRKEAFANSNIMMTNANAYDLLLWDTTRTTNLAEELIGGRAPFSDYQVGLSGGNATAQYNVRMTYNRETNVTPKPQPNDFAGFMSSLNGKLFNDKFLYNIIGNYSSRINRTAGGDLALKLSLPPHIKLYNEDGSLAWNEGGVFINGADNPLATLEETYEIKAKNIALNTKLEYYLLSRLRLGATLGYNAVISDDLMNKPKSSTNPMSSAFNQSIFSHGEFSSFTIDPVAEYKQMLLGGNLTLLIGGSLQQQTKTGYSFTAQNYANEVLLGTLLGSPTLVNSNSVETQYKYLGGFARATYNLEDTYILNVSGRRDGSSRFGPNYKYANFGAVGAAWVFTNLEALKDRRALNFGKLRASYGTVGNDKIEDYLYMSLYGARLGNYEDAMSISPLSFFKSDLHWELTKKLELAADLQFLNGRLDLSLSWYRQHTSDPLVSYPLPSQTGFATVTSNLAGVVVENKGWEIMLNTTNISTDNLSWSTNFNITLPNNKLKKYPGLEESTYADKYAIGQSLNILFLAKYKGVNRQTGLYEVEDLNDSGAYEISNRDGDLYPALSIEPEYYGGMQNNFRYKNFFAGVFLKFSKGYAANWLYSVNAGATVGGARNVPNLALDRWQKDGDQAVLQKYLPSTTISFPYPLEGALAASTSTMNFSNVLKVGLGQVNVGYQFPQKWNKALQTKGASISFQGQNLSDFTLSSSMSAREMYSQYMRPLQTYTLALDVKF